MTTSRPKKIAIVGSGVSGIGTLYSLKHTPHEVHLFEASDRLGGHTNTVEYQHNGHKTNVDTGFIVFNNATYPNFISFLAALNIPAVPTDMTFGVSRDSGAFEWAGTSLSAIFAQRKNIFSLRMWRMIFDIIRFNQFALDLLWYEDESEEDPITGNTVNGNHDTKNTININVNTQSAKHENVPRRQESIGDYLSRNGYSDAFRDDYLIPMTAAVWSTSPEKCSLEFPAMTLVRFMWNHHLLSTVAARPSWMTIPSGSKSYIDAVVKDVPAERIHLATRVVAVDNVGQDGGGKVSLKFENGKEEAFDHVVLACHGDTAYELVCGGGRGTDEEREVLSGFQTTENVAYLHSDLSLMPHNTRAWSAWNLLTTTPPASFPSAATTTTNDSSTAPSSVCLTYNMNILQHIPVSTYSNILVTLNPIHAPDPATIQGRWTYHHPLYNARMIRSQKLLPRIQNTRSISYAGAWTKYGFHEDGLTSGLEVGTKVLGGSVEWEEGVRDSTFARGRRPVLGVLDWLLRVVLGLIGFAMWVEEGFREVALREEGDGVVNVRKGEGKKVR